MKRQPDVIRQKLNLADPCQGVAGVVVSACPEGYRFESLERQGSKAVVIYRRIK